MTLTGQLAGAINGAEFTLEGTLAQLESASAAIEDAEFSIGARNFDLSGFSGEARVSLSAIAAQFNNPQIDPLLEGPIRLNTVLNIAPQQIALNDLKVQSAAVTANGKGVFEPETQNVWVELNAKIDGTGRGIYAQLFANGTADIEARLVRDGQKLAAERIIVGSPNLNADLNAELTAEGVRANGQLGFAALAAFDPRIEGQARVDLAASGTLANPQLELQLSSDGVTLEGEPLMELQGTVSGGFVDGVNIDISAAYREAPVSVKAEFMQQENGSQMLRDLVANVPGGRAEGALVIGESGLLNGAFELDFPDLAQLAPLLLQDALAGSVKGRLVLEAVDQKQNVTLALRSDQLATGTVTAQNAVIDAQALDIFGAIVLVCKVSTDAVKIANEQVRDLRFDVNSEADRYPFTLQANYEGEAVRLKGAAQMSDEGVRVQLSEFSGRYQNIPLRLAEIATIDQGTDGIKLELPGLRVGAGRVSASGTVAERLNLNVRLEDMPLNLVENFASTGQDLEGDISATAKVTGSTSAPKIDYQYRAQGVSVALSRTNQLSALTLSGNGTLANNQLVMENDIGGGGASARANGRINLSSNALNVDVSGQLPFEYLARPLSRAGIRLTGGASVNAQIGGSSMCRATKVRSPLATRGLLMLRLA